jgi:hypothetical protein
MAHRANLLPPEVMLESLLDENNQLISILVASIKTAQRNKEKK